MSKIKNYNSQIDRLTAEFKSEFSSLSIEQLFIKPNDETWSIAENIEHIIVINSSYFKTFEDIKSGHYKTSWLSKIKFIPNLFGKLILKAVLPDRKKKMKTISIWVPKLFHFEDDILKRFELHQTELKTWISKLESEVDQNIVIHSPANKNIIYTIGDAMQILLTHEERHLNQAKELAEQFRS